MKAEELDSRGKKRSQGSGEGRCREGPGRSGIRAGLVPDLDRLVSRSKDSTPSGLG